MPSASPSGGERLVSFGGAAVAVRWDGPQGARIAEFVFGRVPAAGGTPCATYRLGWNQRTSKLALYRQDVLIYLGDSEGYCAELLMNEVCRHLVSHSHGGLLFHAGGLVRDGLGLMLPGAMTTGKSTLTAWLTRQGFDYLTDELVYIAQGSDRMEPFIRPLNLRQAARPALAELDWGALAPYIWPSVESELLPPELLNRSGTWDPPPLRLIVFPHYVPHAHAEVRRLSQAETALALLNCLVNGTRLPARGVPEVARIARQALAYTATYGHLDQLRSSVPFLNVNAA